MADLSFRGVSHAYGVVRALRDLSLDVGEGEVVCLVGPSGCGKTTALRLAAGLERLRQGEILIGGEAVAGPGVDVPPEARGVGLVFQDFVLFPHLSVADNIAFGLRRVDGAARERRVSMLLERVDLAGQGRKFPHMLSGGEQQRVALARALAPQPGVLLLDEPFSGLDIRLREEVRERTLRILREAGATALVVTHDAEEAMYMGGRIAVLQRGCLVQAGAPAEVYANPASAFVAKFLGDVNWVHGVARAGRVDSPLGAVMAPGIGDGERADVLIRPEGLHLCAKTDRGREARVVDRHLLGNASLVTLRLGDGAELRARLPGHNAPGPGSEVRIRCDDDAVMVFACSDAAEA